eukprot:5297066-Amphidinium_carterae.1
MRSPWLALWLHAAIGAGCPLTGASCRAWLRESSTETSHMLCATCGEVLLTAWFATCDWVVG